jgi:pyruvate dehydrogenase complex dehydrogenase (E1) component
MPLADISSYTKLIFVISDIKRIFSLQSMKRRGGVFSPTAQKRYVRRFHASQRNILH